MEDQNKRNDFDDNELKGNISLEEKPLFDFSKENKEIS